MGTTGHRASPLPNCLMSASEPRRSFLRAGTADAAVFAEIVRRFGDDDRYQWAPMTNTGGGMK